MPYYFSNNEDGKLPYIYYNNEASEKPFSVDILLPHVFAKEPQNSCEVGDFKLTAIPGSENHPYKITLSENAKTIWSFDKGSRTALKNDFIKFLIKLEDIGLKPGALHFIRQSLAQYMPLTFMETLYYHYGLDEEHGYVDLHQGMRLRIDFQGYQLPDPMTSSTGNLNGYVGSGVAYYDLVSYPDAQSYPVIGFNAFLRMIQNHTTVDANNGGAGGMVDLLNACYPCRYYRLLYPETIVSSDVQGYAGVQKNVTLIGTNTLKDLESATASYQAKCTPEATVCTFFRGRATAVPEILMYLRGRPTYIPLGTTVRHLMNIHTYIPPNQAQIPNLKYHRWMLRVDDDPNGGAEILFPNYERVNFSGGNYRTYWNGSDCFDIPILKGDAFTFSIPDIRS